MNCHLVSDPRHKLFRKPTALADNLVQLQRTPIELTAMVRLYVGGLSAEITSHDLSQRFQSFGEVANCEVMPPKDNDTFRPPTAQCRGFGFLDLEPKDESSLRKCLSVVSCYSSRITAVANASVKAPH